MMLIWGVLSGTLEFPELSLSSGIFMTLFMHLHTQQHNIMKSSTWALRPCNGHFLFILLQFFIKTILDRFIMKDITSCSPSFYRNLPHAITYDRMTGYMRLNHFWHLPSCKSSWYIMNSSAAQVLKCKSVMGQCELDWFVKYPDGPRPPESVSNNFPEISNFIVCD